MKRKINVKSPEAFRLYWRFSFFERVSLIVGIHTAIAARSRSSVKLVEFATPW